ncbi:MAG: pirin family protein [Deltaproteobacteria bacterium]|nr:pirin family protein [Deltaproteobacteria bacterium]
MIIIRPPESIYQIRGAIQNGTFHGRWHFSFDEYYEPEYTRFGTLRVFNDDTLSPGAIWPLHPHKHNEVVTYCAAGEFRHADEHGAGGILKKGWVQHTTIGRGMWHSEINNHADEPMRFIQMWFLPEKPEAEPSVEQMAVEQAQRANRFLPLVSNVHPGALRILSDARVFSCFLLAGRGVGHSLEPGRGAYLYVLEGGPVELNGHQMPALAAAKITDEPGFSVKAPADAELLLVDVLLI